MDNLVKISVVVMMVIALLGLVYVAITSKRIDYVYSVLIKLNNVIHETILFTLKIGIDPLNMRKEFNKSIKNPDVLVFNPLFWRIKKPKNFYKLTGKYWWEDNITIMDYLNKQIESINI